MHVAHEAVPDSLFKQDAPSNIVTVNPDEFTAAHRLLRADGFDRVVQAENISDKNLKIYFARNDKNNARLGIIASKKTLPRAVDRNRIKRVIRDAFRRHSIKAMNLDLVVLVRRACARESGLRGDDLNILFNRVEDRCAES